MKLTVMKPVEVEATAVRVSVPVRYEEEDIPNNFPLRKGDTWECTIDLETGKIREWPADAGYQELHMKVCDEGRYYLIDGEGNPIAAREQEYVPSFFPGDHYGDYIIFKIGADGVIDGWSRKAVIDGVQRAFFPGDE